ncbi:hypothetical protein Bbelb_215060 [Branchiostoma belcheri]|nr:hypothetical protein Bbelb_215060 [Branchiostoma belcheri]
MSESDNGNDADLPGGYTSEESVGEGSEEEHEQASNDDGDSHDSADSSDEDDHDGGPGDVRGVWMPVMEDDPGPAPVHFTAIPGVKHPPAGNARPIEYFDLYFTPAIIDRIVTETNRYAQQWIDANRDYLVEKPHSVVNQWRKFGGTTPEEIRAFVGLILNMGLVTKSTLKGYWDVSNPNFGTPWFVEHFSRDRFQLLVKFLHFNNNEEQPPCGDPGHKLHKIKPIIDHFNTEFLNHYHPSQNISIDESMVGFKGKTPHIRQFMPQKRHARFGIKLWCVCDSLNGYTSHLEVYKGKEAAPPADDRGTTYHLVMRLLTACGFLNRGHHLGIDNYFSSPELFFDLYDRGTTATGTVRANRKGLPKQAIKKKLRNNETAERRKGPLLCVVYKDGSKKPILLSTAVAGGFQPVAVRRGEQVQKPKVVVKYNNTMGGVDLSDARLYKYLSERRTLKWTLKVAFSTFGRAVLNSFILYQLNTTDAPQLCRLQYMHRVVQSLAGNYHPPKAVVRRRTLAEIQAANENFRVAPAQHPPGPAVLGVNHRMRKLAVGKRRDCVGGHDRRVRTSYECLGCNVGLCPECFADYHRT